MQTCTQQKQTSAWDIQANNCQQATVYTHNLTLMMGVKCVTVGVMREIYSKGANYCQDINDMLSKILMG